jgi:hypothetical protein
MTQKNTKLPSQDYPTQSGNKDLYWIRDAHTGVWVLCQTLRFKIAWPKSTCKARKYLFLKTRPSEELLLHILSQLENDLEFETSSGTVPSNAGFAGRIGQGLNEFHKLAVERLDDDQDGFVATAGGRLKPLSFSETN